MPCARSRLITPSSAIDPADGPIVTLVIFPLLGVAIGLLVKGTSSPFRVRVSILVNNGRWPNIISLTSFSLA
jgi:hypothetical protein